MAGLEFGLAQGWARGLKIVFEDAASSRAFDWSRALHVKQVHGKELAEALYLQKKGREPFAVADGVFACGDAFKQSGARLVVKSADCMPLIYVDRESECVVAVHAGWRGLAAGIHLEPFRRGLCDPKKTWVWMGPCLNGDSFEVGEDMWKNFREAGDPKFFKPGARPEKRYFYAWDWAKASLEGAGTELVYVTGVDTLTDRAWNSYRHMKATGQPYDGVGNLSWVGFGD